MNKKILYILVILVLYQMIFINTLNGAIIKTNSSFCSKKIGNTLIVDKINDRIIEINESGDILWETSFVFPYDVERLENGNTILTNHEGVIEVNPEDKVIWSYSTDKFCTDAERLDDGNTLITDYENDCIIEVDEKGSTIWDYSNDLDQPWDAERLKNGNTLICNYGKNCVLEVNELGSILWSYSINDPVDAERLDNGNTLITNARDNYIVEVDIFGSIVWDFSSGLDQPWDAERLHNGNTLISDRYHNRIIEVDISGSVVWSFSTGINRPIDIERLLPENNVPYIPEKPSGSLFGKPGDSYDYTTSTIDEDGDFVKYGWDWDGDDIVDDWSEYLESGIVNSFSHIWNNTGIYNVKVKAEDIFGAQSDFSSEIIVKISDNNPPNSPTCIYHGMRNELIVYSVDPDGDDVRFGIDWDNDRIVDDLTNYTSSGSEKNINCEGRTGSIGVLAEDIYGAQSKWYSVTYKIKSINKIFKILDKNIIDINFLILYFQIFL